MIGASFYDITKRVSAFSDLLLSRRISIIWLDDEDRIIGVDELKRFDRNEVVKMVISHACTAFVLGNWGGWISPPSFDERMFEYERLKENYNG